MEQVEAVLPVGPWALAAIATVLVVALSVPPGGPRPATAHSARSPVAARVGALLAALALVALVVVARVGPDSELRNPVPALVVGLGWPLLLLVPALVGLVRPRTVEREGRDDVRPAVAVAVALVAYLTLPAAPLRPTSIATALAAYGLVVLAAAVAVGRGVVAARFELLGLLAGWCSVGRALPRWLPPTGTLGVLAVLLGGAWFERYQRTSAWASGVPGPGATAGRLALAIVLAGLGALALHLSTRRGGAPGTASAVLLPLVVGMVVAGVVRRALISAQLLADQVVGGLPLDPDPLGVAGGQLLALGLVVLGAACAAAVLARRMGEETARLPGVGVLLVLTGACGWLVLQP